MPDYWLLRAVNGDAGRTHTDKYGVVWIVTGPIIPNKKPKAWLGEKAKKEMLIAIPEALFKIVIRIPEGSMTPEVLAFRFPQTHPKYNEAVYDLKYFLTTVDQIEAETRLDFLTSLPAKIQAQIESNKAAKLW
ncbi:MAG: DNA/RNA non-specific endonuclease [Candidatus Didemnitutus sp.]|nr:DNA/RNA non-specific endonuclease [Candidatus Didemnitutus sp.]